LSSSSSSAAAAAASWSSDREPSSRRHQLDCAFVSLKPVRAACGVAVTPDGQVLVAGGPDGRLRLWRARTGELLREVPMFACTVSGVAAAADNETIAALLDRGTAVAVVRIPALAALRGSSSSSSRSGAGGDSSSSDRAVATGPLASMRLQARQVSEFDLMQNRAALSVSADGRSVAVSYSERRCIAWSTETRAQQLNRYIVTDVYSFCHSHGNNNSTALSST
jgi:WD40 repeat protein